MCFWTDSVYAFIRLQCLRTSMSFFIKHQYMVGVGCGEQTDSLFVKFIYMHIFRVKKNYNILHGVSARQGEAWFNFFVVHMHFLNVFGELFLPCAGETIHET